MTIYAWVVMAQMIICGDFENLRMGSHGPDDYLRNQYVETINGVDTVVQNQDPKIQRPTAYSQINTMQKVRYMPNNNWNFDLGLFYTTTTDYPRYDRLIRDTNGAPESAVWDYGPQQWVSGNLQIQNTPDTNTLFDESAFTAGVCSLGLWPATMGFWKFANTKHPRHKHLV